MVDVEAALGSPCVISPLAVLALLHSTAYGEPTASRPASKSCFNLLVVVVCA